MSPSTARDPQKSTRVVYARAPVAMGCAHLEPLLGALAMSRLSHAAEAVFSFIHRPALHTAVACVPRCMVPSCTRPTSAVHACVQCVFFACGTTPSHLASHLASRKHAIYLSVEHGRLFCLHCADFVFHPYLDAALELQHRIALNARRNFFSSPSPLEDFDQPQTAALALRRNRAKRRRLTAPPHWAPTKQEAALTAHHAFRLPNRAALDAFPPVGLYNLGNSCYMNSVLQALLHAPPLRCYFLADRHRPSCARTPPADCLACALDRLVGASYVSAKRAAASGGAQTGADGRDSASPFVVPQRVLEIMWRNVDRLASYRQQDAHEFLIAALNLLNVHCKHAPPSGKPETVLKKIKMEPAVSPKQRQKAVQSPTSPVRNLRASKDGTFDGRNDGVKMSSIVTTLFSGTMQSDVICCVCGNRSPTLEKFYDVSLDVDKVSRPPSSRRSRASSPAPDGGAHKSNRDATMADQLNANRNSRSVERQSGKWRETDRAKMASFVDPESNSSSTEMEGANSLFECLSRFTEPEVLGPGSKLDCRSCGRREEAMKQMSIRSLPSIVSFHFKRFEQSFVKVRRNEMVKVDTPVEFPVDGLDLSPFQTSAVHRQRRTSDANGADAQGSDGESVLRPTKDALYDLFAVVNHNGTIDSGHYTTLVRRDGEWYKCDDDKVSKVQPVMSGDVMRSEEAYLVFYVQRKPNLQY